MRRSHQLALALIGVLLASAALQGNAFAVLVADFNSGKKPNNIEGDFGAWNKDPNDKTQGCQNSFYNDPDKGDICLKLKYDVDSPNPAYSGFWMGLMDQDMSKLSELVISIKGDANAGYTDQVKLELKNGKEAGRYLLTGITEEWQEFSVPLKEFAGITDWSAMKEFVIVFDDVNSTVKEGAVYVDDISFE